MGCRYPHPLPLPALLLLVQEALRWAEQATEIRAYAADALALQAGLHLEKRDYHNAKQVSGWAMLLLLGAWVQHSEWQWLCLRHCGPRPPHLDTLTSLPLFVLLYQVLDRLLEAEDGRKHETFAKLAMANLHAYSAPSTRCAPARQGAKVAGASQCKLPPEVCNCPSDSFWHLPRMSRPCVYQALHAARPTSPA